MGNGMVHSEQPWSWAKPQKLQGRTIEGSACHPGERLGLSPGEELHVIQMAGSKGGYPALCQVSSRISHTLTQTAVARGQRGGQKAGSGVACSEAWVCIRIPLLCLGFVCLGPLTAFSLCQLSHLQHRGTNRTQRLGLLGRRGWG